jgi:hypothetical protein
MAFSRVNGVTPEVAPRELSRIMVRRAILAQPLGYHVVAHRD